MKLKLFLFMIASFITKEGTTWANSNSIPAINFTGPTIHRCALNISFKIKIEIVFQFYQATRIIFLKDKLGI